MKRAYKHNMMIDLETAAPEGLQGIYDAAKKGLLSCTVCGSPVSLYLGILEKPHLFHQNSKIDCLEPSISQKAETDERQEDESGFRLPKSRAIAAKVPEIDWKGAASISGNPAFMNTEKGLPASDLPYLNALSQSGVRLDSMQTKAVTSVDGPILVLSGAGSGKTRVLTVRTAYMIMECGIHANAIMLVTFTAKASKEMKERLLSYPGMDRARLTGLVSGTFHSIFYRILIYHEPIKWRKESLLKRDWEKEHILKTAGREKNLDEKEFAFDAALQQIGLWKNSLLLPDMVRPADDWERDCQFLYRKYEEYKELHHKYDFDDMLIGCYSLLKENPGILEFYQNRFSYFLIDEFQDVNKVQYELIKLLAGPKNHICAVGDDDQAIYSFRGSEPEYILRFEEDFPDARIVKLMNNYRSSHQIVATANRIIARNKNRRNKKMAALHDEAPPPVLFFPYDEEQEATMIVEDLKEKIANGARPGDFAILYRTHSMSRALFERLAQSNLPFVIDQDADSFYNRRIVKGMLAFLSLSINPEDPQAAADILPALFLKQNMLQQIKAQSILQDCTLLEAISLIKTGFSFQERKLAALPAGIKLLKDLSPAAALERIEKDLGYSDYIKKRGNEGSTAEKGSDDIRDLKVAARRFASIRELLDHAEHMRAMNAEVKKMSKHFQSAIQLTTIHRSKGLEYECVYMIGAVDGGIPHDYALDAYRKGDSKLLEEERRLLYVAATRAKKQLMISVPQTRRGKTALPSRFIKGLY
ncbi:ATP-dependent helicase [Peribacillus kribbensis]|uniref:ATP-dependent helicase n=1 Tax=Peribacillus kribbensis TaxID=356658 RepID=UPI00040B6D34|nr:ATP-dependent helicase [Peribacillus kribbensis]